MFWLFLLAHLTGDYPLQTDRIVAAKKSARGLTFHVLIHFAVLLLLSVSSWPELWPYLLLIAVIHFGIDALKNRLNNLWPTHIRALYLVDQLLHLLSLLLVAAILAQRSGLTVWRPPTSWYLIAIGALLVSYVWFISERVLISADGPLQTRMLWRLALFAALLSSRAVIVLPTLLLALLFYYSRRYPRAWLLRDGGVIATVTLLTGAALLL